MSKIMYYIDMLNSLAIFLIEKNVNTMNIKY